MKMKQGPKYIPKDSLTAIGTIFLDIVEIFNTNKKIYPTNSDIARKLHNNDHT